jgi:hypothetical protein
MRLHHVLSLFEEDSRGVSEVVGFLLIFAIAIILLSLYQAQFVPQENREIEFQHFEEVRDDLVGVRGAILQAGQTDVAQVTTVSLGTDYPPRLFALNPPPATGTLRTTRAYNITVEETESGREDNVSTRFLEYENQYNELSVGSIWYENSVLYLDERPDGRIAIYEEQNLIRGNESTRVTALQNGFQRTSTGDVTLELYPTESATLADFEGELVIQLPTRLDGATYWNDALGSLDSDGSWEYLETVPYEGETGGADIYWVRLRTTAEQLRLNTVGIDEPPEDRGTAAQRVGLGEPQQTPNSCNIPDSAVFVDERVNGGYTYDDEVTVVDGVRINGGINGNADLYIRSGSNINGGINVGTNTVYTEINLNRDDVNAGDIVECESIEG